MTTWNERLTEARQVARMTRRELADTVGVAKGTVDTWEQGARMPLGENLLRLMEVLPDLDSPLSQSPIVGTDPRDPNGYAVHLPMDPARRARALAQLLQTALDERAAGER